MRRDLRRGSAECEKETELVRDGKGEGQSGR